jgi:hypothetical protein
VDELNKERVRSVVNGNVISFRNDGFQWSFNLFALVDSGSFTVLNIRGGYRVAYVLSTRRMFVLASVVTIFFALVTLGVRNFTVEQKIMIDLGLFTYFFGYNYLALWVRTRAMLRRVLSL